MIPPRLSFWLAIFCCVSCATGKQDTPQIIGPKEVTGSAVRFAATTVAASPNAALVEAIKTSCGGPCARVFVDIDRATPPDVFRKIARVTGSLQSPPRLSLLPPSGNPIELAVDGSECPATVAVESDGIYVQVEGELVTPDDTCDNWMATVCRGDDGEYDWPRLRSVVGDPAELCVHFGIEEAGTVFDALNEAALRPMVRLVGPIEVEGTLSDEGAAKGIRGGRADFSWCFQQVLEDVPPSDVVLKLLVEADGGVARADVVDSVRGTPQFEDCIEDAAMKLRFGAPGGLVVVTQTIETEQD
jgi:hypothetical protein